MIYTALISIFLIAGLAWLVSQILQFKICPICAGVSGTWAWMLMAFWLGYEVNVLVLGILLGGSVAGIAYQLEKRLVVGSQMIMWKLGFIPSGFLAIDGLVEEASLPLFLGLAGMAAMIVFFFFFEGENHQGTLEKSRVEELEKKMKNCC